MKEYAITHKVAKLLMALIVMVLLGLDGSLTLLNGAAILVWIFGTNSIAYLMETVLHLNHKHDKI